MKTTRRQLLMAGGAAGSTAMPLAAQSRGGSTSSRRPNVMVIHCHDLGRHLGCYGRGVDTPNLDKLAAEGVRFTNYFSTAPFCSPSRCSRMTGLYPCNHGSQGSSAFAWGIRKGIKTLPMYMNELGYQTHLFGLQHETRDVKTLGYGHYEHGAGSPGASTHAMDVTPKVLEFLDSYDSSDAPFYMDVGFREVHSTQPRGRFPDGNEGPERFRPKYVAQSELENYEGQVAIAVREPYNPYVREYSLEEILPPPYLPDRPGIRSELADLNALITNVLDVMVGRILDKLRKRGLDESTLVVFTSDHGIDLPRAKGSLYDPGTEVALIMRYPGRFKAGKVFDKMLSMVDFLPTLVELAGGAAPTHLDGRSFLPLVEGRDYTERDTIYLENTWHGFYDPMRGIRTTRFKYIRNFDPHKTYWEIASKAAREVLGRLYFGVRPLEELYDLHADPLEQNNLASGSTMLSLMGAQGGLAVGRPIERGFEDTVRAFRKQMKTRMAETNDPLLKGPVAHPCFALLWDS